MTSYFERMMNFARKGLEEPEQGEMHEYASYVEGDEMYISQAYTWRLISIIESIALILVVFFCVYVAGQNRFIPYVITIGDGGSTFTARAAQHASIIDESIVQAQLKQFIMRARSVASDPVIEQFYINDGTYSMVTGEARTYIDNWYKIPEYQPFERSRKVTVDIDVSSVVRSGDSRLATWTETTRSKEGKIVQVEPWEATMRIYFRPPESEPMRNNPLGLYITALNWTKKL